MKKNDKVDVEYYENGKKESEYTEFRDGGYVGTCWFEDGNIGKEETCKVGEGFHETIYFVDGKKYSEKHFKEDGSGVSTYYYPDGTKREEGQYNKKGDIIKVLEWLIYEDGKRTHKEYRRPKKGQGMFEEVIFVQPDTGYEYGGFKYSGN
jgi:hypothetical protein